MLSAADFLSLLLTCLDVLRSCCVDFVSCAEAAPGIASDNAHDTSASRYSVQTLPFRMIFSSLISSRKKTHIRIATYLNKREQSLSRLPSCYSDHSCS